MDDLLILPTFAHVGAATRNAALRAPGGIAVGRLAMTIAELEQLLVAELVLDRRLLAPAEERILWRRIVDEERVALGLEPGAPVRGHAHAMANAIELCRRAMVGVEDIEAAVARGAPATDVQRRLLRIAAAMRSFERHATAAGIIDGAGARCRALDALRRDGGETAAFVPAMLRGRRIVLRHVVDLFPARLALLDALARALGTATEVVVEIPHCGPSELAQSSAGRGNVGTGAAFFGLTERLLANLEADGAGLALTVLPVDPFSSSEGVRDGDAAAGRQLDPVRHVGRTLGRILADVSLDSVASARAQPLRGRELELASLASRGHEDRHIARRVRDLVDGGADPAGIVVALGDYGGRAETITRAIEAAGVAVERRRGSTVAMASTVRWVLAALAAGIEGLQRDPMIALLTHRHAGRLLRRHGLSGRDAVKLLDSVAVRAEPTEASSSLEAALTRLAANDRPVAGLTSLRALVVEMVATLAPLREPLSPSAFVATVRAWLDLVALAPALGRRETLALMDPGIGGPASPGGGEAGSRGSDAAVVRDVLGRWMERDAEAVGFDARGLDALAATLERLESMVGAVLPDDARGARDWLEILADSLASETLAAPGLRGMGVRVTALADLPGQAADVVMIPGLAAVEVPAIEADDPFLPLRDRLFLVQSLRAQGRRVELEVQPSAAEDDGPPGAPGQVLSTHREVQAHAFVVGLAAAGRRLLLCRPLADEQGRPLSPSPFFEAVESACATAAAPIIPHVGDATPAPTYGEAAGRHEVLRALAFGLGGVMPGTDPATARDDDPRRLLPAAAVADAELLAETGDLLRRAMIERYRLAAMVIGTDRGIADRSAEGVADHGDANASARPGDAAQASAPPADRDAYCGRIVHASLATIASQERALSPTAIEDAVQCPFRFFARHVLRLPAADAATDDLDGRISGSVAHRCFEAVMLALIDRDLRPFSADRAEQAAEVAVEVAGRVATEGFGPLAHEPALLAVQRQATVDRMAALIREMYRADDGFAPHAVEQTFGKIGGGRPGAGDDDAAAGGKAWPALAVAPSGSDEPIYVHGRIDLVEIHGHRVRVSDLKSSRLSTLKEKLSAKRVAATDLQLPLYAAAARHALGCTDADARFLSLASCAPSPDLSAAVVGGRSVRLEPAEVLDTVKDDGQPTVLGARVGDVVGRLRRGRFPVAPLAAACDRCDYGSLCRTTRATTEREDA